MTDKRPKYPYRVGDCTGDKSCGQQVCMCWFGVEYIRDVSPAGSAVGLVLLVVNMVALIVMIPWLLGGSW